MKKEKTRKLDYFTCDQCGYNIGPTRKNESVDESDIYIVLRVGGKMFHFCKPLPDVAVYDHTKSCIARWFLAQQHVAAIQFKNSDGTQQVYVSDPQGSRL